MPRARPLSLAVGLVLTVVSALVLVASLTAPRARAAGARAPTEVLGVHLDRAGAPPEQATVRVTALGCGGYSFGSGVLLDDGRVLTARHVVSGATSITVEMQTGEAATVRVAVVDAAGRDAALLHAPAFATRSGVAVAPVAPAPGDPIVTYGHPRAGPLTAERAAVLAFTSSAPLAIDGGRVMTVDAPFDAGVSGGPVVDGKGALVALAIGVERLSGVGIALPVDAITSLVDGYGVPVPTDCESPR